ncbi:adenylate/guanylate cyclase domain-containing protein [Crassaminicella profunda]|uniref:adenylate/guanylate cyclase domain-containing protein n=1 Tax=Crassaminicella profunda TaxID=1286698 RepID=UPI001CA64A52|nr:adenylate/guanylate cyclase domain-containing protein [Crassaminicella profunda]QZY55274.1 tetratricopeptide repeat protein [Crassaminicella profunda]
MGKKLILTLLFIFMLHPSLIFANENIDQLLEKLDQASTIEKPDLLNQLAEAYLDQSPSKSIEYGNKALSLSNKLNLKDAKIDALTTIGMAYYSTSDFETATKFFSENLSLSESFQYKKGAALNNTGLGLIYHAQGDFNKASEYFSKSLALYKEIPDQKGMAQSLNNIGAIKDAQGDYEKALDYYLQALDINTKIQNKEEMATCLNNIGSINQQQRYYNKSFNYYLQALKIFEEINNQKGTAVTLNNIADIYILKKDYEKALTYFSRALKIYTNLDNKEEIANTLNNIGYIYDITANYPFALQFYEKSLSIREEIQDEKGIINSYNNMGTVYHYLEKLQNALDYHTKAYEKATKITYTEGILSSLENIAFDYKSLGDYKKAFLYYEKHTELKNALQDQDIRENIIEMETKYETEKKQMKIELLAKENKMNTFKYRLQLILSLVSLLILLIVIVLGYIIWKEKKKSEKLLLNILPSKVAHDLKKTGKTEPESFENVTVYFSDIVGFTKISSTLKPKFLIDELNDLFTHFDNIMEKHSCERIKTIGDAYLAICGMHEKKQDHAQHMIQASIEILDYLNNRNKNTQIQWQIRIGIHSGNIVGGVVGIKKYIYDVFGDTINTASRMESNSDAMKINVSEATYNLTKDDFSFIKRASIEVKGKGLVTMYFVDTNQS